MEPSNKDVTWVPQCPLNPATTEAESPSISGSNNHNSKNRGNLSNSDPSNNDLSSNINYLREDFSCEEFPSDDFENNYPNFNFPRTYPDYHLYYDQFGMSQEPSGSLLEEATPSWSEIDGIISDKYKSESDPPADTPIPTQSTQDTVVQDPISPCATPIQTYHSQPQFIDDDPDLSSDYRPLSSLPARINADTMATPPRVTTSTSFGSSQRDRIETLRRELLEEEERVMARSEDLDNLRNHARSALIDEDKPSGSKQVSSTLDSSQQLSHSILEEESKTRLKMGKPPSTEDSEVEEVLKSVSIDMTPLTEDLLLNSRVENIASDDGAQTISDGQFPNDDEIVFTPLSDDDDDFTRAFATPPQVVRKVDVKVKRPTPKKGSSLVQIQTNGKVIGNTELASFDETTSSLSILDKGTAPKLKDGVQPLRRHAWSDSETDNTLSRSMNRTQLEEYKSQQTLPTHTEKSTVESKIPELRADLDRLEKRAAELRLSSEMRSIENRPRSAFAVLSPHEGRHRPLTAPSSEKVEKFDIPSLITSRFVSEPERIGNKVSDTSIDSADYPNLKNSFMSLQNTIMTDIAALRREIVEKQEGTEKLRSEFTDFKHAYYQSLLENQTRAKILQDANIQTSQCQEEAGRKSPYCLPPIPPIVDQPDTSYSECDSETDRQLATLTALKRSLREQTNEKFLRDMEKRMDSKKTEQAPPISCGSSSVAKVDRMQQSSPAHVLNRSMQTAPSRVDVDCNTSDVAPSPVARVTTPPLSGKHTKKTTAVDAYTQRTQSPVREPSPLQPAAQPESGDSSLDSTQQATRELFMDILRKKAEQDEEERKNKVQENKTSTNKVVSTTKELPTSTPKAEAEKYRGKCAFTPASIVSDDSTLTDGTCMAEQDMAAINALWEQFMKFAIESKALKQRKPSSKRRPLIEVDVKKLEKLQKSFSQETYRKDSDRAEKNVNRRGGNSPKKGDKKVTKPPEMFDVSAGELKKVRNRPYSAPLVVDSPHQSADSREERINRLIMEIEEERRHRQEKRLNKEELSPDLDAIPVKDDGDRTPTPPPAKEPIKAPVAFEISLDMESVTSEEVERAPGYPNMVFKTGKLQDAFHEHKRRFIKNSRRRALQIQLCKEARQRFADRTPPERPRPTVDPNYFLKFDIPPPRHKIMSHKEMVRRSKKIYEQLSEVQKKKKDGRVQRERETYRLRAKLFNKKVQDSVLGKKYINSVRVM